PGKGTHFTITLPLTLAVLDGMTICVGDERFILPLSSVVEALRLENCEIERLPDNSRVLARRGEYLRLMSLRSALGVKGVGCPEEEMAIVVDTETNGHVALLVDELIGQRQVVLKSLEANFRHVDGVSGATILGDGRVALILDVPSLVALGASQHFISQETFH
ncbi:MAG: two-component system chemotaxis sensor kinase CheA, partial [Planctomycetota bacterium]